MMVNYSILLDYKNKSLEELKPYINNNAFRYACANGHLEVAQWLLSVKPDIDISFDNDYAFSWVCENGHLEVAQWLLSVKPDIDISAENDFAFIYACTNGRLEVAKWLLSVNPDINISNRKDYAFTGACEKGHLEVAQWLSTLDDRYQIKIENDKILDWKIIKTIKTSKSIIIDNPEDCCICYESANIKTSCGHYGCHSCLSQLESKKCPYCRQEITQYYKIENKFL